jgi:hypothetical protein
MITVLYHESNEEVHSFAPINRERLVDMQALNGEGYRENTKVGSNSRKNEPPENVIY